MASEPTYTFDMGICAGSKPEIMLFVVDTVNKRILSGWQYTTEQDREKMYTQMMGLFGHLEDVIVAKGSLKDGKVTMDVSK